jgi:TolC family type I secretion outer membrane protein
MVLLAFQTNQAAQAAQAVSLADPFGVNASNPTHPGILAAKPSDFAEIARQKNQPTTLPDAQHAYTLAELSALALQNNPQTRIAWAGLQAQAAAVGIAESAWLPKINLSLSAQQAQITSSSGYAIPVQKTASPNVSLSWLLWDFGQRDASINAAQAAKIAARFANDQAIQTVLAAVANAYYQSLADRVLILVNTQSVKTAQSALDSAQARYRAGQATVSDLYQARAALAQAQGTLATAEQTRRQNEGTLASSLGLPVNTPITLAPLETMVVPRLQTQVQAFLDQAIAQNPNLQNAQALTQQARATLDQTERAGLPSISLNANQGIRFQQGLGNSQTNSIGLTLTVPLFTGFNQQYQTAQARAKLTQAEATRDNTYQTTELAVWQAYYAFSAAAAGMPSARAQVENATEALKALQAQYTVGYTTIQDLLTAQSTLATAQVTLAQGALNAYTALAKLGAAVGQLGTPNFSDTGLLDPTQQPAPPPPSPTDAAQTAPSLKMLAEPPAFVAPVNVPVESSRP